MIVKLYGVKCHRSSASNFGAASALLKWSRPCKNCGQIANFGTCKRHRSYEPKILVFKSARAAARKAQKLNEQCQSNFLSYEPTIVLATTVRSN